MSFESGIRMKGIRKKERRENREFGEFTEIARILMHFFPNLSEWFNRMPDPRCASGRIYSQAVLVFMIIMKNISAIVSMRQMNEAFNTEEAIRNLGMLAECELKEMPDWQTVNNYLSRLDVSCLQEILAEMIFLLIRCKTFNRFRLPGKYWGLIIDGTGHAYFKERHCEHDLVMKSVDKKTGKTRTFYYHKILEAKIILAPDIVVSIGSEFIENETEDVSKQDCEQRAAERLLARIKQQFPKLPSVVLADGLYATMPFMSLCRKYKWHYILNLKEGSQKLLYEDFMTLLNEGEAGEDYGKVEKVGKELGTAYFANNVHAITGKPETCNILRYEYEYEELNMECGSMELKKKCFVWVTDLEHSKRTSDHFICAARSRWDIEEAFNFQKNGIYEIEHLCSRDSNGMKVHYILAQIADIIMKLTLSFSKSISTYSQSVKGLAARIKGCFCMSILTDAAVAYITAKCSLHYNGVIE